MVNSIPTSPAPAGLFFVPPVDGSAPDHGVMAEKSREAWEVSLASLQHLEMWLAECAALRYRAVGGCSPLAPAIISLSGLTFFPACTLALEAPLPLEPA
jgi:hypothetical protein